MGWVVIATPLPLYPWERPSTHCIEDWEGPRAGLDGCGKSRLTGIRSPDRPARKESLYRLSYPGPQSARYCCLVVTKFGVPLQISVKVPNIKFHENPTSRCRANTCGEEYRYTHVDVCVARTWISYRCVPCHPWSTHRTSLVVKKKTLSIFLWLWTIPLR
jgi:hypothetical protein